jgi:hypothetical protein
MHPVDSHECESLETGGTAELGHACANLEKQTTATLNPETQATTLTWEGGKGARRRQNHEKQAARCVRKKKGGEKPRQGLTLWF